jgi:hypothetical protein
MTTSVSDTGPFPQTDLAVNASGRLSDNQRRIWRSRSRGVRKTELTFAVIFAIIGALVAFSAGPAKDAVLKPVVGLVCLVIVVILVVRALTGGDAITKDVRSGRVDSVEGAITKRQVTTDGGSGGGSSDTTYYLDVSGKRLEVSHVGYEAAPEAGWVRLYYLPASHHVVNLERLPDPAQPELTPATAQGMAQTLFSSLRSHNESTVAEARAQAAAMGSQFTAQAMQAAIPPPPEQRDARPLAEAIIGSWTSPFISVTFAADGTVTSTMLNGRQMAGQWSIDAQGQLHAGIAGNDNVGEAWVVGNTLTVSEGGMGLSFQRTG